MTLVQAACDVPRWPPSVAGRASAPLPDTSRTSAASGLVRSAGLVDLAPWLSRDVLPPAWWLVAAYYASCGGAC